MCVNATEFIVIKFDHSLTPNIPSIRPFQEGYLRHLRIRAPSPLRHPGDALQQRRLQEQGHEQEMIESNRRPISSFVFSIFCHVRIKSGSDQSDVRRREISCRSAC